MDVQDFCFRIRLNKKEMLGLLVAVLLWLYSNNFDVFS